VAGKTPILGLTRQEHGAVDGIGKTAMAAADHHGADGDLAGGGELAAEGRVDGGMAEREADVGAVGQVLVSAVRTPSRFRMLDKVWFWGG
jgi:hypothetical protein